MVQLPLMNSYQGYKLGFVAGSGSTVMLPVIYVIRTGMGPSLGLLNLRRILQCIAPSSGVLAGGKELFFKYVPGP